jgi:FtsH-binding integral membrane protein
MKTDNRGYNSADNAQSAVTVFAWLCLMVGIILLILTLAYDGPVGIGIALIGISIPLFITRGVLEGFKSVVRAAEKYLDQEESTEKE